MGKGEGAVRLRGTRIITVGFLQGQDIKLLKGHEIISERELGHKAIIGIVFPAKHIPGAKPEGSLFEFRGVSVHCYSLKPI